MGKNEVRVKQLPASIDKDSIRVDGRGKGTICEVQYLEKHVTKEEELQQKTKEVQQQLDKLKEVEDRVSFLRRQADLSTLFYSFKLRCH